jgi:hypothetical protein
MGDEYISAKNCFRAYCNSDAVRNSLVSYCKSRDYSHCDSLKYHDTYVQDLDTQRYTYNFVGNIDYDEGHAKVTPSAYVSWSNSWDNGGKEIDTQSIRHTIDKSATASWTSSKTYTFEEDIDISVTAGIPAIMQAKTGITDKFKIGSSTSQSHTETIDQSYDITDSVQVAPYSCDTVCVDEDDEDTVVPYTLRGDFQASGVIDEFNAYVCCYLRDGGDNSCNWGGHGGAGWMQYGTARFAAEWGTAQGDTQCPHIKPSGNDAHIDLPGSWTGGMKINHKVRKIEQPSGQCATCDPSAATLTSPALTIV